MHAKAADSSSPSGDQRDRGGETRREREALALRENLARRKAQTRARSDQGKADQDKAGQAEADPPEDPLKCR